MRIWGHQSAFERLVRLIFQVEYWHVIFILIGSDLIFLASFGAGFPSQPAAWQPFLGKIEGTKLSRCATDRTAPSYQLQRPLPHANLWS